jgi:hypothetical protein
MWRLETNTPHYYPTSNGQGRGDMQQYRLERLLGLIGLGGQLHEYLDNPYIYLVDHMFMDARNVGKVLELGLHVVLKAQFGADRVSLVLVEDQNPTPLRPNRTCIEVEGRLGQEPKVYVNGRRLGD